MQNSIDVDEICVQLLPVATLIGGPIEDLPGFWVFPEVIRSGRLIFGFAAFLCRVVLGARIPTTLTRDCILHWTDWDLAAGCEYFRDTGAVEVEGADLEQDAGAVWEVGC